jgi:hypothetical protein
MHVEPGVLVQPGFHVGVLVGAVVVADHVDVQALGHVLVDLGQELLEPVARHLWCVDAMAVPSCTFNAANKLVVPCRK